MLRAVYLSMCVYLYMRGRIFIKKGHNYEGNNNKILCIYTIINYTSYISYNLFVTIHMRNFNKCERVYAYFIHVCIHVCMYRFKVNTCSNMHI